MTEFAASPDQVVAILQERAKEDSYIREVLRGAILEAALLEATQGEPDNDDS